MIVKVLHKCGHDVEHNYKGRQQNLPAWLFKASEEDCPNCMFLKLSREAREKKMPDLTGTISQCNWAMTIRNEIFLKYNDIKKEYNTKKLTQKRKEELFMAMMRVKNILMSETEAAFWIAHKSISSILKYRKIRKIKPVKKPEPVPNDYEMNFEDANVFALFEEERKSYSLNYL